MLRKQELLALVREKCKKHRIDLYLGPGQFVRPDEGICVNGYFDNIARKLAVATARANWQITLAHEFSHMCQWIDKCQTWKDYHKVNTQVIDDTISHCYVKQKTLDIAAKVAVDIERDCEKRTHKLLKEFGHPKEQLLEYIQKANAYCLFYLYLAKHHKWYEIGKEPYNLPKVWRKFPRTFEFDIHSKFKKLENLYKYCVKS